MKIAYIRSIFPKNSETFIIEEVAALKRQGHEIRIFAALCDFAGMHAKVIEERLLDDVIYLPIGPRATRQVTLSTNGRRNSSTGFHPQSSYFKNYLPHQSLSFGFLTAAVGTAIDGSILGFPWRLCLTIRNVFKAASRIGNLSLAISQCITERKGFRPDIIHSPFAFPWDIFMLSKLIEGNPGVPFTMTLRARDLYTTPGDKLFAQERRSFLRRSHRIITISSVNRNLILRMFPDREDIPIIHSSIDTAFFTPQGARKKRSNQIIAVARLIEKKGLDLLIEACWQVRSRHGIDLKCRIVGEGALREKLEKKIAKLDLADHVRLEGQLTREVVRTLLDESEVFVLPCIVAENGDRDVLPNSVKEAMAMALPVVTSNISGIEELIDNENEGILIAPGSLPALVNAIVRLLRNHTLRERLGSSARKKVINEFNIDREGAKFSDVLAEVVGQTKAETI